LEQRTKNNKQQMIPFNKPYLTGKELTYIADAVASGKISGNGNTQNYVMSFLKEKNSLKILLYLHNEFIK